MRGVSRRELRNRYKMTYVNCGEWRRLQEEICKNEAIPWRGWGKEEGKKKNKYRLFLENESIGRRVHREDKWKLKV